MRVVELLRRVKRQSTCYCEMESFTKALEALPETVAEFSKGTWSALVEYMMVYGEKAPQLIFWMGMEIRI